MNDPDSYALDELTWPEVGRLLARDPRLLLAVGSLEQHGSHLPLGTNTLIAARVTEAVSQDVGILRAPPVPYGVLPGGRWDDFSGRAGLRRKTLHRALNELLADWEDQGVEEFVLVTAHRYEPHLDALLMALTSRSRTTVMDLHRIDVTDLLDGAPEAEHGGELETSLLLHLAPERVRNDEMEDVLRSGDEPQRYVRGGMPTPPGGSSGTVGRPTRASAEKGEQIFRRYVRGVEVALARD
jgi:creatinine amidohydrolase